MGLFGPRGLVGCRVGFGAENEVWDTEFDEPKPSGVSSGFGFVAAEAAATVTGFLEGEFDSTLMSSSTGLFNF